MNVTTHEKLEEIRLAVGEMCGERDRDCQGTPFYPSEFWLNLRHFMSYIRTLPTEHLEMIRAHVGMGFFIGNPWDKEFYDGHRVKSDAEAEQEPLVRKYIEYTQGLPDRFKASECKTNPFVAQIGINYQGRLINKDVLKEQACISNMYHLGLLEPLVGSAYRIVEVGPGYGQLAHQLTTALDSGRGSYILVDFPETLFWSATFVAINQPAESLYIYRPGAGIGLEETAERFRFIFLPNYRADLLRGLRRLDLAVNQNSFQEMSERQVRYYLELFSTVLRGWLYSYNADRQFMNSELGSGLGEILQDYFIGGPDESFYERLYGRKQVGHDAKRLFFGYPKNLATPPLLAKRERSIWVSDRLAKVDLF